MTDTIVIDEIVLPAARKNRTLDITGCLWFDVGRFLQVLEGPRPEVDAIYSNIVQDHRHTDIRLLTRGQIESRTFDRWGLRAVTNRSDESIDQLIARYLPQSHTSAAPSRAGEPSLLHRFKRWLRAAAESSTPAEA